MTDAKLKALADRIERLMDERDGIQGDIRDVFAEAKSVGYVPKVLRKAITRKRMDPLKRDEEDTILDLYEDALSPAMRKAVQMAAKGASARKIEEETGIDQATVARSVSLNKKSETLPGSAPVAASEKEVLGTNSNLSALKEPTVASDVDGSHPAGEHSEIAGGSQSCGGVEGHAETTHNSHHVGHVSGAVAASAGIKPGPQDTVDLDAGMPPFLRRPKPNDGALPETGKVRAQ